MAILIEAVLWKRRTKARKKLIGGGENRASKQLRREETDIAWDKNFNDGV